MIGPDVGKRRPKDIGTECETAALKYLQQHFNSVRRSPPWGAQDQGDLHVIFGDKTTIMFQVKGGHAAERASDAQVEVWSTEAENQGIRSDADLPVLVVKRKGKGMASAHLWWAFFYSELVSPDGNARTDALVRMPLGDAVAVLKGWGYR